MNSRYFTETDYGKLVEWWNAYNFTPIPMSSLSSIGIMVSNEEEETVCGFLYLSNSDLCWVEFIVSNPNIKDKAIRTKAITQCINQLCEVAKEMNYRIAFTSLENKNLQDKYLSCGFVLGSEGCNEYTKIL